jgi:hypothetical protein
MRARPKAANRDLLSEAEARLAMLDPAVPTEFVHLLFARVPEEDLSP